MKKRKKRKKKKWSDKANIIAASSQFASSAPRLTEKSSKASLIKWLKWNDRNGDFDNMTKRDAVGLVRFIANEK